MDDHKADLAANAPGQAAAPDSGGGAQAMRARGPSQAMRTQGMVIAFYLLDTLLLAAFAAHGVVSFAAPLAFGMTGCGVSALFALAIHLRLHRRIAGENFTTLQLLFACSLIIATAAAVPQIALLLLMTVIVAVATAALQLPLRRVIAVAAMVVVATVALLLVHGDRVGAPLADVAQRILSGLWFSVILAKIAAISLIGTQVRNALSSSNARLAVALDKVRELSERDDLTGLRNRRSILTLLAEERARFARGGPAFGVAILDIDHFKQVNDRFGHATGDTVLRAFAQTVAGKLRGTDHLARYGGEEFLLMLPVVGAEASAEAAAQRLRRAVNEHAWSELAPDLKVTCSIGVTLSQSGEDVATMLERADAALYQAKASGRDAVCLR